MVSKSGFCLVQAVCLIILEVCGCALESEHMPKRLCYNAIERQIKVDGDTSDWVGIKKNVVEGPENLWFGQGMTPEKWKGNDDSSFSWRAAWYQDKLYFLIEVTDDNVQPCIREYSWLNECVEIYLDYRNLQGPRIEGVDVNTSLEDRLGKNLRGYEMHFLPCFPPKVFLSDVDGLYRTDCPQNNVFFSEWKGEVKDMRTSNGYLMEIGLSIPGMTLRPGTVMGVDVAVGDDDGEGRKSLLLWTRKWTGKQVDFWITMDYYGQMTLVK